MADLETTKNKFSEKISEENIEQFEELCEIAYNRKSVDRIKRAIVFTAVLIIALPIYLGLYTLVKLNGIEERVDKVNESIYLYPVEMQATDDTLRDQLAQDYMILDSGTVDMVAKAQPEDKTLLGNSLDGNFVSNGKTVYLTFDDGPSEHTAELLDVLKEYNIKATFFVVCNPDESLWPMYERIVEEGHTLAMHSYTHVYDEIYVNKETFIDDVTKLREFLYEQTGVECDLYRFPGGSSNSMTRSYIQDLIAYLDEQGITYFDWNSLSEDAVDLSLSPDQLNDNIMGYVRANEGNSVVLMHDIDACENTLKALPALIETLQEEGYTLRPIDNNTVPVQHVQRNSDGE